MKVLIISHAYVERDNHKKIEELSKMAGLEVGVVYPISWKTWHGEDKQQLAIDNGQLTYREYALETFFSGDGGRYFYNPRQLFSAIRDFKPDLIHLEEEPFTPVALQVSIFSRLLKIRMIFFSWENINFPLGAARSSIEQLVFKMSNKALAGSSGAVERLRQRGYRKDVVILPQFGVDTEAFKKESPCKGDSFRSAFTVGFVGRPSLAKGIDTLFQAIGKLESDVRLLIVTSSPSISNEIITLTRESGIRGGVEFKTSIPHSQLPEYFNLMDVFVLPSRTTKTWKEQFGRTLIEAMACGIPVIGSSSGAIPEVIGENGFIFKEGDSEDLSKHIKMLSSDADLLKKMSELSLRAVREKHSFEKIAEKTAEFYFSIT